MASSRSSRTTDRELAGSEELIYSQQGRALINQLSILIKTAKIYSSDNKSFRIQLDQCYQILETAFAEEGELSLQAQSGYLFFCGVRIRHDVRGFAASKHLQELFHKLDISGFVFATRTAVEELEQATLLVNTAESQGLHGFEKLQERFDSSQIESIAPLPPVTEQREEMTDDREKRSFAKRTFFYAVNNLKTVTDMVSNGRQVDAARTKRVIHSLVDQILSDESYLLELTALKSHDQYTFLHSANVCIYSICLGARLNLTKAELSLLGFAALFHDIGKTRLPLEILNKPSDFNNQDWEVMRMHPIYGVLAIARSLPFDERSCRAMTVSLEHHYNLDGTGYPETSFRRSLNLYSKIVAICDVFDAMSSGRVYRKNPVSPEHVLRNMIQQAGFKFDKNLLKVFLTAVSLHPPGTIVLLDNRQYALVVGKNPGDLLRPKVKVIGDGKRWFDKGIRLNLADRDPATGQYLRSIAKVVDPRVLNVDCTRFVLE